MSMSMQDRMGNKIASQERVKYFTCEHSILVDFRTSFHPKRGPVIYL